MIHFFPFPRQAFLYLFVQGHWHIRSAYYGVFLYHEALEYPAYSLRFLLVTCMPL
jgi:hypothetical protein